MWEKSKKKSIILYKSLILEAITNKCGGRCLKEASYILNDVTFCVSWRFCEEVASSPNSHRSKMLWRFGIFVVLVNIQDLWQIFTIVKMSVKMLYLHWVEGTPQLGPFPSVWSSLWYSEAMSTIFHISVWTTPASICSSNIMFSSSLGLFSSNKFWSTVLLHSRTWLGLTFLTFLACFFVGSGCIPE